MALPSAWAKSSAFVAKSAALIRKRTSSLRATLKPQLVATSTLVSAWARAGKAQAIAWAVASQRAVSVGLERMAKALMLWWAQLSAQLATLEKAMLAHMQHTVAM
jgi:hypothetical protein